VGETFLPLVIVIFLQRWNQKNQSLVLIVPQLLPQLSVPLQLLLVVAIIPVDLAIVWGLRVVEWLLL